MYSKYIIMFSYPQSEPIKKAYGTTILEKSSLGYATNNVHPQHPPKMDDGRSLVASHQPEAILNETLLKESQVQSNWEYRKYLTENSQRIARDNFREACNDTGYIQRFTPDENNFETKTFSTPLQYKESNTLANEKSDLKQLYLTKEELQKKYEPVTVTQDALFAQLGKK